MAPLKPLPHSNAFAGSEDYVHSLLELVGKHELFRTLCGGVHILDFFTSDPPLYTHILPLEWREFFAQQSMPDLLHLYLRQDLDSDEMKGATWRDGPCPPESLTDYLRLVRDHLLDRDLKTSQCARNRAQKKMDRQVSVGMKVKKLHEVGLFASYIDALVSDVSASLPQDQPISHLVDFGAGQGYLDRALALEPYNRDIIAIESRSRNTQRSRDLDIKADLVAKTQVMRNKKAFRAGLVPCNASIEVESLPTMPPLESGQQTASKDSESSVHVDLKRPAGGRGTIQYVFHRIESGDLTDIVPKAPQSGPENLMVMSLHSCGNLVHHGLRSLILNSTVKAVAMVGCCYNLITERLGPATYKIEELRPTTHTHSRLGKEGEACDPDGFPMSQRFCDFGDHGLRLNITARMMAVQAPKNWCEHASDGFFKRHFYRALLQRIFLDRGVVSRPCPARAHGSPLGHSSGGTPIIIGSLTKGCYESFTTYVRAALKRLHDYESWRDVMGEKMGDITDDEIETYERDYRDQQKDLSVIWSLMAFSAVAVEAAIVVDRWLWLKEQDEVKEAWVESVFDYALSPRNLVVVGIKK